MSREQKSSVYRIIMCIICAVMVGVLNKSRNFSLYWYIIPYAMIGLPTIYNAVLDVFKGKFFTERVLMSLATLGALYIGNYLEAMVVLVLYEIGEILQDVAVERSNKSIEKLMDIRPDYVNIRRGDLEGYNGSLKVVEDARHVVETSYTLKKDEENLIDVAVKGESEYELVKVKPDEVVIGTTIIVLPGEKIAIDGEVVKGTSNLNTSSITGESMPVSVKEGDKVLSGSINKSGVLEIKTTATFTESTVSKVLDIVQDAENHKSETEKFMRKFAKYYTPFVYIGALILLAVPFVLSVFNPVTPIELMKSFDIWLYRALNFLVISCPCALVISVPLAFYVGIGRASREGILIKGSIFLEKLAKVCTVVFDKTGTLTDGVFEVSDVYSEDDFPIDDMIEYAAHAEYYSSHMISICLKKLYWTNINLDWIENFVEYAGKGVSATVKGKKVIVGNMSLMKDKGIVCEEYDVVGTVSYVAIDGKFVGVFKIADKVKEESSRCITKLKEKGVKKIVMLTGDNDFIAKDVGRKVGIADEDIHSMLLPHQKVAKLGELLKEKDRDDTNTWVDDLVFVGDGINDAPVLIHSDIGIAMGGIGSDAAIEASDIVLMEDNPEKIVVGMNIAEETMSIVRSNVKMIIGIKLLFLLLSTVGVMTMSFAVFADVGVMLIAVLRSIKGLKKGILK